MAKITRSFGTGMTERGVVEFGRDDPQDVAAQVAAAIESLDRTSFSRIYRRLAGIATAILEEAGLPCDPVKLYAVRQEGTWRVLEGKTALEAGSDSQALPLISAVVACGYPEDSPQGYAASVLVHLKLAELRARAGDPDEAMALAFAAGELANEAGMKATYEQDSVRSVTVGTLFWLARQNGWRAEQPRRVRTTHTSRKQATTRRRAAVR